jgi:hypothetical protein
VPLSTTVDVAGDELAFLLGDLLGDGLGGAVRVSPREARSGDRLTDGLGELGSEGEALGRVVALSPPTVVGSARAVLRAPTPPRPPVSTPTPARTPVTSSAAASGMR